MPRSPELSPSERDEFMRKYERLRAHKVTRAEIMARLGAGYNYIGNVRNGSSNPSREKLMKLRALVKELAPYPGGRPPRIPVAQPKSEQYDVRSSISAALSDISKRRAHLEELEAGLRASLEALSAA